MRWEDGFPVLGVEGKVPSFVTVRSTRPGHVYAPVVTSDEFRYAPDECGRIRLAGPWEWNHIPDDRLWSVDGKEGFLEIRAGRLSENVTRAVNVLTQRSVRPRCGASVEVDAGALNDGDYAGICALQGRYGMVALAKEKGELFIVMKGNPGKADFTMGKTCDRTPGVEYARVPWTAGTARLRVTMSFDRMADEAMFHYLEDGVWKRIGATQKLFFGLDHFVGCRFGLFLYATQKTGGKARFRRFSYERPDA
jgi:beta-xylosidase